MNFFNSCIYSGFVTHRRFKPKRHFFSYKTFSLLIDLPSGNNPIDSGVFRKKKNNGIMLKKPYKEKNIYAFHQLDLVAIIDIICILSPPDIGRKADWIPKARFLFS